MQFERMRDFLWIKLIGFQQISMRDCAICEIRIAGINEKDGLTPANFCLKRCIRILEIQRGIFLNDSFLRCLWALFLSRGPIYRRRMGLGHNVSDTLHDSSGDVEYNWCVTANTSALEQVT